MTVDLFHHIDQTIKTATSTRLQLRVLFLIIELQLDDLFSSTKCHLEVILSIIE